MKPSRLSSRLAVVATAGLVLVACSGGPESEPEEPTPAQSPEQGSEPDQDASEVEDSSLNGVQMNPEGAELTLDNLPVSSVTEEGEVPEDAFPDGLPALDWGWDEFGLAEGSPCDSEQATLVRDGTDVVADEDCVVTDGTWFNLLGGSPVSLDEVEVAPFVPVEHVWQVGASGWDENQQSIYANAPDSIVPVDPEVYAERGGQGPDEWRPEDHDLWCNYALRWISVKNIYGLPFASDAEHEALDEMVSTCGADTV